MKENNNENEEKYNGIVGLHKQTISIWDMIDPDLEARLKKSPLYHFDFAQLLLEGDQHLWDGKKTIIEVAEADQAILLKKKSISKLNTTPPTHGHPGGFLEAAVSWNGKQNEIVSLLELGQDAAVWNCLKIG
ncbi:hypothetical protein VP01_1013g2 [Puccinia sorghi]|uniref:Uncharacterized protein n=1 Tax=Puccinia sorghi TaxID=27349 RepID=A0A0L6VVD5_9BASI|nr:hypothetical protein VP01_1013g2 [Puccinia sorghi]